ncbi:MAG: phosphoribosyl transferase [Acidithiobacillales bacterium SM23_46]|jgi:putative phosphoribosyl transferase|nr:MAG: phosphoribosyl transferase [Acidithiobacillales bacterium SM23_46]KPL28157.1 MAG: phosphoribosyl transferase [Acidithiobacillales bacterium SM1_46]
MRFRDRTDAGKQLSAALSEYRGEAGVVLALPRGGVVLGIEVAEGLGMPLDLVIPRKIGHPQQPEYAIAAVAESGELAANEAEVRRVDPDWFRNAVDREQAEAKRRRQLYLGGRAPLPLAGKLAILVDDGIATGLTMFAAIRDVKQRSPARTVVAVPVAPADTVAQLRREVDAVVTLDDGEYFLGAVGAYYDDFPQVSDSEVVALMQRAAGKAALEA